MTIAMVVLVLAGALMCVLAGALLGRADRRAIERETAKALAEARSAISSESLAAAFARDDFERLRAELEACDKDRARAVAGEVAAREARVALERRMGELESERKSLGLGSGPVRPLEIETGAGALEAVVQRVGRLAGVRAAVIADELGLAVASTGGLDQELAAIGAFLARSSVQARQVLELRGVRRVTVEDERGTSVTVRRLVTGEDDLTTELVLVTLTAGSGPTEGRLIEAVDGARRRRPARSSATETRPT